MSRSEIRVALCTDGVFPHALGGMQRHSRLLAEHLARHDGVKLTVLHPHDTVVFDPALGITEARIAPMDPRRFYLKELRTYSGRIAEVLERTEADVVLSQGFSVMKDIHRFGKRLIVLPHGLEMFQGLTLRDKLIGLPFRRSLRYVVRRAAVTISLGGKLTPILQGLVGGTDGRVVEVPNATEVPDHAPEYPQADGPLHILFVGRFASNKGIDVLLGVARRLISEGHGDRFLFTLAGDGPERDRMLRDGLPKNVELAGKVDDPRLNELYASCHTLLLPTRFEGMPTVVLEAMARARPAIVSDVGASAVLIGPDNGFLLPPGNAEALHTALLEFAALTHEQRKALGEAGYARVRSHFSWPAVTARMVELFREVTAKA